MSTPGTPILQGATEPIEALILDDSLAPLTAKADILVWIRRKSDGLTYDWNDSTFKVYGSCTTPQQTMTEVDATNYPGQYARDWVSPSADGIYEVTVDQSPGTDAANVPQVGEIRVGGWVDDIAPILADTNEVQGKLPTNNIMGSSDTDDHDTDIDTLVSRLTAARALNLDEITAARLAELDPANLPADIDTLLSRLTAARALNLDEITAARLAELDAANLPADMDTLLSRLTVGRATNLDNLDATISSRSDFDETTDPVELLDTGGTAGTSAAELVADVATYLETSGPNPHGTGAWDGIATPLTAQQVRDAMKLAPTGGAPAAGSVDEHLDDVLADTSDMQPKLGAPVADLAADIAAVQSDTDDVQTRLPAALVGGRMDSDVAVLQAAPLTAINTQLEVTSGHGAGAWTTGVSGLTAQQVRDAMKLAPTGGAPAVGSVDEHLDDILADTIALETRLTALRAANLDELTAVRMAELDAANLPADIDTLLSRLTALRAGYLDELGPTNVPQDIDTLISRLTALRAANLDEITAIRLAELDATNIPADVDTLLTRLTAGRATNLDNLDVTVGSRAAPIDVTNARDAIITELKRETLAAETTVNAVSTPTSIKTGLTQADDFFNNMQVVVINVAGVAVRNVDDFIQTGGEIVVDTLPFTPVAADPVFVLARTGSVPIDLTPITSKLPTNFIMGSSDQDNHDTDIDTLVARLTAPRAANLDEITATRLAELDASNLPADIDQVKDDLKRMLGLAQENQFLDNTVFDVFGQVTSARIRIFDSKANCDAATDGGSETTGLVASYTITGVWESQGRVATYKQTQD